MMRTIYMLLVAVLLAGCANPQAADRGNLRSERHPIRVADVDGKLHAPLTDSTHKASVLIFITTDCPIANSYAPEIQRLTAEYEPDGIKIYLVHADPDITADKAKQHAQEYRHTNTVLLDQDQALARTTGATVTPEAAVLSPGGFTLYRGRIDDSFATYGRRREVVTKTELRDALDAILQGRPVPVARTEAIGCHIPL